MDNRVRIYVTYTYRGHTFSVNMRYDMSKCNMADFSGFLLRWCISHSYKVDDFNITINKISNLIYKVKFVRK